MSMSTFAPYLISTADVCTSVFVIAMTQTFMCFLHFARTEEYMQYLKCNNLEQQRASNAFLHVRDTEFFALDTENGRRYAIRNLLGLVKFWEAEAMENGGEEDLGRDDGDVDGGDIEGNEEEFGRDDDDIYGGDLEGNEEELWSDNDDTDGDDLEGSEEELGRDGGDTDGGNLEGGEEGDSEMDIDDSNDEDHSPRDRKRKRYVY
jgi:hypothetical protein